MSAHLSFRKIFLVLLIIFSLGLAACSSVLPRTPTVSPATATLAPTATDTPAPTATSQPPLAVLLVPSGADSALASTFQSVLTQLSSEAGLRLKVLPSLSPTDLNEDLRLVVVLPPDPGLEKLAASAPDVQFLGIGMPGLKPAQNLSLIGSQGDRPDRQGFLAGYIAAVITDDWRVGMIGLDDTASKAAQQGFVNGAVFFCGLCRSAYPPFYQYPIYAELPAGAGEAEAQATADYLIDHAVQTAYIFPGAGDDALLDYLAKAGVNLIGGAAPPAGAQNHWVASIHPDLLSAVRQVWPDLVNGKGGANLDVPLVISDQNEALFSQGRQRLAEQTLAGLQAGLIDTGVDLQTSEPR